MASAAPVGIAKPGNTTRAVLSAVRWTLVVAYAWSAGGKFFWPERLREIFLETGMIPNDWAHPLVHGLPALELLLALGLASKALLRLTLLFSTFLSAVFAGIHGYVLASGRLVPCGCCGVGIEFSSWGYHMLLLLLSLGMLIGSVALLFGSPGGKIALHARRADPGQATEPEDDATGTTTIGKVASDPRAT